MKRRVFSFVLCACLVLGLLPAPARALSGGEVTLESRSLYANGRAILLKEGSDPSLTVVCGSDGAPLEIAGLEKNGTGGTDLGEYSVYGGAKTGDVESTSVTMEGGSVWALYAGCNEGNVSGTASVAVTGGQVGQMVWGGSSSSGTVGRAVVSVSGGTVGMSTSGQVVAGMATESASVSITGGTVTGRVRCVLGTVNPTVTVGGTASISGYELLGIILGTPGGFDRIQIEEGGFTGPAAVCVSLPENFEGEFAQGAAQGDEVKFILAGEGAAGRAAVFQEGKLAAQRRELETDGDGRYRVSSVADLCFLRDQVNCKGEIAQGVEAASADYVQTGALDLSGVNWLPIGLNKSSSCKVKETTCVPFGGTYDGGGYAISQLTARWPRLYSVGLFGVHNGWTEGVTLSNLNLENCSVEGLACVGALLGGGEIYGVPYGPSFENCRASGSVTASGQYAGGLAGKADRAVLSGCAAEVAVAGAQTCGGLVGAIGYKATLTDCHAAGSVTAVRLGIASGNLNADAGGLAGSVAGSTECLIQGCSATGDVTASSVVDPATQPQNRWCSGTGGLIGQVGYNVRITDCFAAGDVSGEKSVGGLVGSLIGELSASYATGGVHAAAEAAGGLVGSGESYVITNCYAAGDVAGDAGAVGGLLGNSDGGTISHSYALGGVTAGDCDAGGIVGYGRYGTVENCFALGAVESLNYRAGGIAGTGGTVRRCAALNPSVTSSGDSPELSGTVGRVCGGAERAALEGNFAFSGMAVTVDGLSVPTQDGAADGPHGEDRAAYLCLDESSYPQSEGWTEANGWRRGTGGNDYLPLSLMPFSRAATPEHLKLSPPLVRLGTPVDLTETSAQLSWSAAFRGMPYRVELEYRAAGETVWSPLALPDTSHVESMEDAGVTLSGLTPGTEYEVRLTAAFGEDGSAVRTRRFRTAEETELPPSGAVQVEVTGPDGTRRDVVVSLESGDTVLASQSGTATEETPFSAEFTGLADGCYNLVVRSEGYAETRLVEVPPPAGPQVFRIPAGSGSLSSVVELRTEDTPRVAVNGLEQAITQEEREEAVQGTGDTEVRLVVERRTADGEDPEQAAILELAGNQTAPLFLDISLWKTRDGVTTEIGDQNTAVLELAIPYDTAGKTQIRVYRFHGGAAQALTPLSGRPARDFVDGTYFVGRGFLFVYASSFSAYAVDHTAQTGGQEYHTITATAGEGGGIAPSGRVSVARYGTRTFSISPQEGYEIDKVLVDGTGVGAVSEYTFRGVTADHTIEVRFRQEGHSPAWNPFTDVGEEDWFYGSVKEVYERDLMQGTSTTLFSPYADTSRGMIAVLLWRLEGSPAPGEGVAFSDVDAGAYYAGAVAWCHERGIVLGFNQREFRPEEPVTREQLAAILWRYAEYKSPDGDVGEGADLSAFQDAAQISEYAVPALQWAFGQKLILGRGEGLLDPRGRASRAETAALFARFLVGRD